MPGDLGEIGRWLAGDLTARGRVLAALAPALLATAWFVVGVIVFAIRCRIRGLPRDPEVEARGRSFLVGYFLRHYLFWVIGPFWRLLVRSGIPADALTALSLLLGGASGVAVAVGRFALGGWLFLFAGILDALDGRLARARGEASARGAAMDSVLDRYTDAALLIGLAWYYRASWVLVPVLLALVGGALVPYVRAKGEGLGVNIRDGLMQRGERVLILGGAVALSPILEVLLAPEDRRPFHWLAVVGVCVVAVLSNVTAVGRLRTLLRALDPRRAHGAMRRLGFSLGVSGAVFLIDYTLMLLLAGPWDLAPVAATALAACAGAALNFALNRVFRTRPGYGSPAGRYALTAGVAALLAGGGVALLALLPLVDYRWGWWVVRGLVWLGWSIPLYRGYVFAQGPTDRPVTLEVKPAASPEGGRGFAHRNPESLEPRPVGPEQPPR